MQRKMLIRIQELLLLVVATTTTHAWISDKPVSQLLQQYEGQILDLQTLTARTVPSTDLIKEPYCNKIFYLRYCLDSDTDDDRKSDGESPADRLSANLKWRLGPGKAICDAAAAAVEAATAADDKGWNNAPVLANAPHSATVAQFLTPQSTLTTTSSQRDLVYCIRAGQIDDTALMQAVTVEEMVDFFLYAKEVNAIVANQRSTEHLVSVITCNDLSGVGLSGSADFRKALSASSGKANDLYPATSGPTLLCNLPPLLNALVKLFTPLFPPAVTKRLKFSQGLFKGVDSLTEISAEGSAARKAFLQQIDKLVY